MNSSLFDFPEDAEMVWMPSAWLGPRKNPTKPKTATWVHISTVRGLGLSELGAKGNLWLSSNLCKFERNAFSLCMYVEWTQTHMVQSAGELTYGLSPRKSFEITVCSHRSVMSLSKSGDLDYLLLGYSVGAREVTLETYSVWVKSHHTCLKTPSLR